MSKIGLLGGTFDPVHNGHLYMANTAYKEFNLDKIVFLPLNTPPHKSSPIVSATNRLDMLNIITANSNHFIVWDLEIKRQGLTYSIDTLSELKQSYPTDEFYYIIGSDTLLELKNWKDFNKISSLCNFIFINRPNTDPQKIQQTIQLLQTQYNTKILTVNALAPDISSTLIRQNTKKALPINDLVPKSVQDYITKHKLYQ